MHVDAGWTYNIYCSYKFNSPHILAKIIHYSNKRISWIQMCIYISYNLFTMDNK
jgi:hypothetical protein